MATMTGYTDAHGLVVIPIQSAIQVSGTATVLGPIMTFVGEVVGASISSVANSIADDGSNKFVIDVTVNANVAFSFDTNTTDLKLETKALTENSTAANKRFAVGEQLKVVFTETGTAVNLNPGTTVWVTVFPGYDYAGEV